MKRAGFIFALVVFACTNAVLACPFCKEAIPNTEVGADLPAGFNFSIYSMLIGLFTVMAVGGWKLVQVVRQTDRSK